MGFHLWVGAGLALAAAALYVYIYTFLGRRHVAGDGRIALLGFRFWWLGLAISTLLGLVPEMFAFGGSAPPLAVMATTLYANLAVICVALWGLLYYLLFLYSGKAVWWKPLAAFYVAYFVFLMYVILDAKPIGVVEGTWATEIAYATPLDAHPLYAPLILLLLLPQLGGAIAYGLLYFRVKDVGAKYRVSLVSVSILVWFGSSLLASFSGLGDAGWWFIASRAISFSASLGILLAYRPPKMVATRLAARGGTAW